MSELRLELAVFGACGPDRVASALRASLAADVQRSRVGTFLGHDDAPDGKGSADTIALLLTGSAVPALSGLLLAWLRRNRDTRIRIKVGDTEIDVSEHTNAETIETFLRLLRDSDVSPATGSDNGEGRPNS